MSAHEPDCCPEAAPGAMAIGHYRFIFTGADAQELRGYQGSAWRGALGHALKQVVCVTGWPECAGCALEQHCIYPALFSTRPPADRDRMRRYADIPHH